MKYPQTRKEPIVEEFFGTKVADPYRWLEDDNSPETLAWVKEQQAVTEAILNEYPKRKAMLTRLQELHNYAKMSHPTKRGAWYYYSRNDGLQNQWVTYRKRTLDGAEELFLDPNALSADGTTTASAVGRSKDNRYFTYQISKAGADAGEFWIMDTETKTFLDDKLLNMKFSGAAWYKDGYFYSRYDDDTESRNQNTNQKIYYHKLGESKDQDTLIYEDPEHPLRFNSAAVSDDLNYLFIHVSEGTSGNNILYKSLSEDGSQFKALYKGFSFDAHHMDAYEEGFIYLFTNKDAKNFRLLKVNLENPAEENWEEIIPQREYLLESASIVGQKIIAIFTEDVQSRIEVLDLAGKFLYPISMPYQGTAQFTYAEKEDSEGYFYFSSYVRPYESYHYDVANNKLQHYHTDSIKAELGDIVSEQIFFASKDGTKVPMSLIYKKGMQKNGANPVFLYGYGGFNISLMPEFSLNQVALIEQGFICVIVNLRGGGEYGESWHEQGMLLSKQNVFDDFIAAAEYLIKEGYTNPDKIAINGGSNGGLLVGACLTQRPDLFKVAVPAMGVLDMLRYHKFTCGWGWMVEYGNPDEEEQFHNILKYSPLHNVKAADKYPAVMVVTADHDDRVIPGHSFKFAATLQEKISSDLPLLLYTQFQSAHGASSMSKGLEKTADIFSFILKYLEV
ncbi:MAG: prolyl oligopeptidase family serine peptidase [Candidatus Cloacimonetes bacterium]|nr:prolyl oligopeptidase family serine peptidase [Candidatus Cloacimonadota bacterium]